MTVQKEICVSPVGVLDNYLSAIALLEDNKA